MLNCSLRTLIIEHSALARAVCFTVCLALIPNLAHAQPMQPESPKPPVVESILLPGVADSSNAHYRWQVPTDLVIGPTRMVLNRYDGGVKGGVANGLGRLVYGAPFIAPPAPGTNEFVFQASYGPGLEYTGKFSNGKPNGIGELYSRMNMSSVRATFSGFWPDDGPVTTTIFGRKTIFASYKNGVVADGPVKLFLYTPSGEGPTRVFLGEVKNGKQTGTWSTLPWREAIENGEIVGYGKLRVYRVKSQPETRCTVTEGGLSESLSLDVTKPLPDFMFIGIDPDTVPQKMECENVNPEGWRFRYSVAKKSVFDSELTPLACSDNAGLAGSVSLNANGTFNCKTTKIVQVKSNNLFAKVWREVKRTPGNILNIGDRVGNSFADLICDIVQKKKGKDCNVNIRIGKTFDLPENVQSTVEPGPPKMDAVKSQAAASMLARLMAKDSATDANKWAQAAAEIYSLCVQSCVNPAYQQYSLLRMNQIEAIADGPTEDGAKGRQIASFYDDIGDIFESISSKLPVVSTAYKLYIINSMSNRIVDARLKILSLPYAGIEKEVVRKGALDKLELIGIREILLGEAAPTLMEGWKDAYALMLPKIPELTPKSQYQILRQFGLDAVKFVNTYQELQSKDEFIAAAVAEIMKPVK